MRLFARTFDFNSHCYVLKHEKVRSFYYNLYLKWRRNFKNKESICYNYNAFSEIYHLFILFVKSH